MIYLRIYEGGRRLIMLNNPKHGRRIKRNGRNRGH